jgi:PBP1b-binding outer membrane lipoprotein LpoB
VRRYRWLAAIALAVVVAAGCGPKVADYQSVWTTTTTTTASAAPQPFAAYLDNAGVTPEPVALDKLTDVTVTLPSPPGWEQYNNPHLAPGTRVIAKNNTYPTATLVVYKLNGDFDVKQAVAHSNDDAKLGQNFKQLNASDANFHGFPSSMIEGSYDLNGARMQSYNRIVFPTGSPPANQRYFVQLTVTTFADKAAEQAPDIEAIIKGFTVTPK